MKMPRGFGKNYFSLNAITATVNGVSLQKESSRVHTFYLHSSPYKSEDETLEELEEQEAALCEVLLQNAQACHCNCFYLLKTRLALLINLFIPRCPFYTVCFAFRRTGVHPPLFN